jgi:hypothetical protein
MCVVVRSISSTMIGDLSFTAVRSVCLYFRVSVFLDNIQKKHGQFLFCFSKSHPEKKPVVLKGMKLFSSSHSYDKECA